MFKVENLHFFQNQISRKHKATAKYGLQIHMWGTNIHKKWRLNVTKQVKLKIYITLQGYIIMFEVKLCWAVIIK